MRGLKECLQIIYVYIIEKIKNINMTKIYVADETLKIDIIPYISVLNRLDLKLRTVKLHAQ